MNLDTATLYLTGLDNKSCKYESREWKTFDMDKVKKEICDLHSVGIKKIIFAGGEPLLLGSSLEELIIFSSQKGIITGIITNGSKINVEFLSRIHKYLDEINITIDSLNTLTNIKLGKFTSFKDEIDYHILVNTIQQYNIAINIHTTVTVFNQYESLQDFIDFVKPGYWLIKELDPSVNINYKELLPEKSSYNNFISKHRHPNILTNLKTVQHS